MKGTYPRFVYILMTLLGASVLVINAWMDLTVAVCAIGAGLFAYGVNRLIGEWRVKHVLLLRGLLHEEARINPGA